MVCATAPGSRMDGGQSLSLQTMFGQALPSIHSAAGWMEGKACPYKPCSDYCQFPTPYCMINTSAEEVIRRVDAFLTRTVFAQRVKGIHSPNDLLCRSVDHAI